MSTDRADREDGRSLPVAIVDNDAAARIALEDLFEASGTACKSFESAEALLSDLANCEFSCFVLDFALPGLSGLELQAWLVTQHAHLPIIFLTASDQAHWRRIAMENGARAYLEKPADGEQVLECVRNCLDGSGGSMTSRA